MTKRQSRAMTLIELMVVVSMGIVLTTLGMVGIVDVIQQARYRAERARFYLLVREARDQSASGRRPLEVRLVNPGNSLEIIERTGTCAGAVTTTTVHAFTALQVPVGGSNNCFDAGALSGAAVPLQVQPPGGAIDSLTVRPDGRLDDSWGEFPAEGGLDTGSCDPDNDPQCGK